MLIWIRLTIPIHSRLKTRAQDLNSFVLIVVTLTIDWFLWLKLDMSIYKERKTLLSTTKKIYTLTLIIFIMYKFWPMLIFFFLSANLIK